MEKLKLLDTSVNMDKTERTQALMTGVSFLFSGIKNMKESPKVSIVKSIIGGFYIYQAISGHSHFEQVLGRETQDKNLQPALTA